MRDIKNVSHPRYSEIQVIEGIPGVGAIIGKLLEAFGQKVYVYVEVSFNHEKPYRLIVINRSGYEVVIENMEVTPDGFPEAANGWNLNESNLYKNKALKPGQRINFYLGREQIGELESREFKIQYHTKIMGKSVPRKEESCVHTFEKNTQTVNVTSSFKL